MGFHPSFRSTCKVSPPIWSNRGAIEVHQGWVLPPSEVLRPPLDSFLLQWGTKRLLRSFYEKLPPTTLILSPAPNICIYIALHFSCIGFEVAGSWGGFFQRSSLGNNRWFSDVLRIHDGWFLGLGCHPLRTLAKPMRTTSLGWVANMLSAINGYEWFITKS